MAPPQPKMMKMTARTENVSKDPKQTQIIQASASNSQARHAPESQSRTVVENHTLKELQKTNELLSQLIGRMKKTEERVRGLEDKVVSASSSNSSSDVTPKRSQSRHKDVPPEVRVRILYDSVFDSCI